MKKFNIFTFEEKKESLMTKLQKVEAVEFIDLKEKLEEEEYAELDICKNESTLSTLQEELSKVKFTIESIEKYVEVEKGLKALLQEKKSISYDQLQLEYDKYQWHSLYEQCKRHDESLVENTNKIAKFKTEIEALLPWQNLDVAFTDMDQLKTCVYAIGSISKNLKDPFTQEINKEIELSYLEVVSEKKENVNILIICHDSQREKLESILKHFGFTKANFNYSKRPQEVINSLEEKIQDLGKENALIVDEIKSFQGELEHFKLARDYLSTQITKYQVQNNFLKTDHLLIIQGWVPVSKVAEFERIISLYSSEEIYCEFADPIRNEDVPILLKNNAFADAFEPVTEMYSLPSYFEIDPTPIMAVFMFVLFGTMLSDAGYGFLMFIGTIWALKKVPLEPSQRKFVKLFFYLSISTMVWGIIYGSYFGDALSAYIKPLWIDPTTNPMAVLILGIAMGTVHIFTGLGIKAAQLIKDGKWLDALLDVGLWYMTLIGAFLLLLGVNPWGKYLFIIGLIGIVLTQGRSNKTIVGKLAGGFYDAYGITGYLGDFLSYSRLLALGLATGLIGSSFNLLARLVGTNIITLIFSSLIFAAGHAFNLAINVLGAYVHGARLQYLEFFGKFYSGGGRAFTPFKSDNKYFTIINKEEI